jgi:hypothetical protein
MANPIPTPSTSSSTIDNDDKRYPRPGWFRTLRSVLIGLETTSGETIPKEASCLFLILNSMLIFILIFGVPAFIFVNVKGKVALRQFK